MAESKRAILAVLQLDPTIGPKAVECIRELKRYEWKQYVEYTKRSKRLKRDSSVAL
jgi:hypothetical protein